MNQDTGGESRASVVTGLWGWFIRMRWRSSARRMSEPEIDELRKRIIIVERQLESMPVSSRVRSRRMELLRDRERCQTIVNEWEAARA